MTFEEFAAAVQTSLEQIPPRFKRLLKREGIKVIPREQVPSRVRAQFAGSVVFGIFVGISRKEQSVFAYSTEPTRIEIYQESFEQSFGLVLNSEIREQINRTVIHEVAHYFGFNEREIRSRGF